MTKKYFKKIATFDDNVSTEDIVKYLRFLEKNPKILVTGVSIDELHILSGEEQ